MFHKIQLKQQLLEDLDTDIEAAISAAQAAQQDAAHEDNQPENQYDTLSLEAAYLAHGQSERIRRIQDERIRVGQWSVSDSDVSKDQAEESESIRLGSLVCLAKDADEDAEPEERWIWITPIGGREIHLSENQPGILVISKDTPLAKTLFKLDEGDDLHFNRSDEWYVKQFY
ncbi:MAG: hypothetical protein ACPGYX_01605 [Oceanobacter sp.]